MTVPSPGTFSFVRPDGQEVEAFPARVPQDGELGTPIVPPGDLAPTPPQESDAGSGAEPDVRGRTHGNGDGVPEAGAGGPPEPPPGPGDMPEAEPGPQPSG